MKAQSSKKKEKEKNNKEKKKRGSRSKDMQQGSRLGQRICSKKNQHQGPMYVQISSKKTIRNPAKSSERTGLGYLEARDPWDVHHSVGLRQLKRGTTKYKK